MKRVLKYELGAGTTTLDLTCDARPLKAGEQNGRWIMWVLMDKEGPRVPRRFVAVATGQEVRSNQCYVDTIFDGSFVWHVFEVKVMTRAIEAAEVHVKCGHCSGTGNVIHNRMTQAIRSLSREWVSTAFVAEKVGVSATNAANLLRQLFESGKVERRGAGHGPSPYEWRHGEILNEKEILTEIRSGESS